MNDSENFWDKTVKTQDKDAKRFDQINSKVVENTRKYLKVSDIVLDYGCGTGTKACELAGNVKNIQGIDIASKVIEAAKRKAAERKIKNVDFAQATIFDERYKRESFDVILAFNILHALEDDQQAMQRITELLKPGGSFISTTPCLKEKMTLLIKFQFSLFLLLSRMRLIPIRVKKFKFSELNELIANGYFQIVETENLYQGLSSYFIAAKKIRRWQ